MGYSNRKLVKNGLKLDFLYFILGHYDYLRGKRVDENFKSNPSPQYITNHGASCDTYRRYPLYRGDKRYKFVVIYLSFTQKIYDVEIIGLGEKTEARIGSDHRWYKNGQCAATACNYIGNRMIFGKGTNKWTLLCHVKAYAKLVLRPGEYTISFF